ncbi:MAG TPA: hypothetical protein VHM89_02690 [Acidimicrobiales bacterium]|nr:hypothetical protein [Acidimicrobiales bacterium]
MRSSHLWATAAVTLGVTVAACSSGSEPPTVASVGSQATTTAVPAETYTSTAQTPLAQAQAYSQCMRNHDVPNFPDPELTPGGDYGYRTNGVDGKSAAFQAALQACKDLPSPWNSTGGQLSAADQQAWLRWAKCIRANGVPDFADPTFSGEEVHVTGGGPASSPQLQSAMNACKSQMPSTGGLGG